MKTYRYTTRDGWQPCTLDTRGIRAALLLPAEVTSGAALGPYLFRGGYTQWAQTHVARCAVGHFVVWSRDHPDDERPLFALEITQIGAEGVVWIEDLPSLWDFLAKYGPISVVMQRYLPGEEEDLDEGEDDEDDDGPFGAPRCPDCGKPMSLVLPSDNDDAHRPEWDA